MGSGVLDWHSWIRQIGFGIYRSHPLKEHSGSQDLRRQRWPYIRWQLYLRMASRLGFGHCFQVGPI
jgi:hypothetical protein